MGRCTNHPKTAQKRTVCAPCRKSLKRGARIFWQRGRPLCETCARAKGIA